MYDYISACRYVCVRARKRVCASCACSSCGSQQRAQTPATPTPSGVKAVVSCREGGGPGQKQQMFSFAEPFLQPQI